jgi:O-antigen/teichoic acid export membrane protein
MSIAGILGGLLRRHDLLQRFAVGQVAGALVGLVSGGVAVLLFRSSLSLSVSVIATPTVTMIIFALGLGSLALPGKVRRDSVVDVIFGLKSAGSALLGSLSFAFPQWIMSVRLDPAVLGSWNRAVAVAQLPAETLRAALLNVAYHRFARQQSATSPRAPWTFMTASFMLLVGVTLAIVLPVLPALTRAVLGPSWDLTQQMVAFVAIGAGVSLLASPLAMALEATGHFRPIFISQVVSAALLLVTGVMVWRIESWVPFGIGFVVVNCTAFGIQSFLAARLGLVDLGQLLRRLWMVLVADAALLLLSLLVFSAFDSLVVLFLNQVLLGLVAGALIYRSRRVLRLLPDTW